MKNETNRFKVIPLPQNVVASARATMTDEAGNRLAVRHDRSRHQCRSCLALTEPGEGFLLLSHRPFPSSQPYAEAGPIFIHERECTPYAESSVFPPEFPRREIVVRAYGESDEIVGATLVTEKPVEEAITELFADPRVAYLHSRNAAYGCYMFRVERG